MAIVSINAIKNWFKTGMIPTQDQFWSVFDSFRHKDDKVPVADVEGINELLATRASQQVLDNHLAQKGAPNGYAPLDEFTKLAAQYLNIVNDLVTGGATALLSAEQGKVLQGQISAINTLLTSDNVDLDTVQELVDAIETVQLSLSSILVNDLTTGGTTKALTAEMGKLLQANKIDKLDSAFVEAMIGSDASSNPIIKVNSTKTNIVISVDNAGAGLITYIIFGAEFTPYDGKLFTITNKLNTDLTLGQAFFKTVNQVLHSGATVSFLYDSNNGNPVFRQIDGYHETTDFLNKDIRLGNYPSTRNDGQLPTNKVLAPDVNGNLKLYTIATAPAPYLYELIPDSYLPSNTGNFILKGSFFTPNMTVQIVGQTVNYTKFISDNEVHANVTTGSAEGSFDVILNNGISRTFPGALLIVLGTVYKPVSSDWTNINNEDVSSEGELNNTIFGTSNSAVLDKTKMPIKANINFRFQWSYDKSPLGTTIAQHWTQIISFHRVSDDVKVFEFRMFTYEDGYSALNIFANPSQSENRATDFSLSGLTLWKTRTPRFKRVGGLFSFGWDETTLFTFTFSEMSAMYVKFYSTKLDYKNIKYIETA